MKFIFLLMAALVCLGTANAAEFDARAVFGYAPGHDVDAALKRGAKDKKRVIMFSYDPMEGGSWPGFDITSFMDLKETKKLVKDNFIVVVLERGHKDLERYRTPGPPEKAYYALIKPDGKVAKTDTVYRNPSVGLTTVKAWLAMP